jgi:hypothetical protein
LPSVTSHTDGEQPARVVVHVPTRGREEEVLRFAGCLRRDVDEHASQALAVEVEVEAGAEGARRRHADLVEAGRVSKRRSVGDE